MRVKVPHAMVTVMPDKVQIISIDARESDGKWYAWGYEEGNVESQFIVAEQDRNNRWHLPDQPDTPPPPVVMERIRNYVSRLLMRAVGE